MTRFLVFEPNPGQSAEAVFVRDRFRWLAFLLPVIWLLSHRLFLAALLVGALQFSLSFLGATPGFGTASVVLGLLLSALVALEGPGLVARRLRRRGFHEAAAVNAHDLAHAELLYYGRGAAASTGAVEAPSPAAPAPLSERTLPLFGWRSGRALLSDGAR